MSLLILSDGMSTLRWFTVCMSKIIYKNEPTYPSDGMLHLDGILFVCLKLYKKNEPSYLLDGMSILRRFTACLS